MICTDECMHMLCTNRMYITCMGRYSGTTTGYLGILGMFSTFFLVWLVVGNMSTVSTREEEFVCTCRGVFRGCTITIENEERGYPVVQEFAILHKQNSRFSNFFNAH